MAVPGGLDSVDGHLDRAWRGLDRHLSRSRSSGVAGLVSELLERSGATTATEAAAALGARVRHRALRAAQGGVDAMVLRASQGGWDIIVDPLSGHVPSVEFRIGHEIAHILVGLEGPLAATASARGSGGRREHPDRVESFCDAFGDELERQLAARTDGRAVGGVPAG